MDRTTSRSRRKAEGGATPRADQYEADLLGLVLTHPQVFETLDLTLDDFFDCRHKLIVAAAIALHSQDAPVYLTTLADELAKRGELEQVGGFHGLDQLMAKAPPNPMNADYLAKQVRSAADRRRLVDQIETFRERLNKTDRLDELPPEFMPLLQACGHRSERLRPVSAGQLLTDHSEMRPAVIEGLLRVGETANLIAAPKMGKSWLTLDLVMSVATGRKWLGTFDVNAGPVLLIDNELHPETLAKRLPTVAEARGIRLANIADKIQVITLRGRLRDLLALESDLRSITPGTFKLIVLDAFYRFLPEGTDENDNSGMARLYNCVDRIAERLGCAVVLIHHASKGNQSGRGVTDVGSGAGAQSRAVDAHIVLRPHEDDGAVVLDAAVRSWAPIAPVGLRWDFPIFNVDPTLDPTQLRRESGRRRKADPNQSGSTALNTKEFATKFLTNNPSPKSSIIDQVRSAGFSERQAKSLLERAEGDGVAHRHKLDKFGRIGFANVPQSGERHRGGIWPVKPPS